MERKFYHTEFEEFIKEKSDQYKMYPSDRVWKSIDRSLRSKRKWYWSGFVLLLSGISYLAITHLVSTSPSKPITTPAIQQPKPQLTAQQLNPFGTPALSNTTVPGDVTSMEEVTSDITFNENGDVVAAFEIPLKLLPGNHNLNSNERAAVYISGLAPLKQHEQYNFELSWPVESADINAPRFIETTNNKLILHPVERKAAKIDRPAINWLFENDNFELPVAKTKRISWQLAFSPTVNYRRLTGSRDAKNALNTASIPVAVQVNGNIDNLVNHKPALGFELGTHGMLKLNKKFTAKAGLQFNYSKYDIRAFKAPRELTMIALNSQTGINPILGYSDVRNFGGTQPEDLKNQYFQLSMPVGIEYKVFGNDKLQFSVATTLQPTYLLNSNTYLITTDFKNYAKEPSLVRKWNMNAGAEAFIAYERGGVKWQVGPQFRYQLLSSYRKEYPIKEYLMEYGIKVGITKTIR